MKESKIENQKSKISFPPGPRSKLPWKVFKDLRKNPLAYLTKLAEDYGDICSFSSLGQRYVILNHPDLVKEILLTQADAFWKGPALQNSKGILGEGLLTAEGDIHKRQRRLMTPAFHAKQVENYTTETLDAAHIVMKDWTNLDAPIDIRPEMMRLTLLIAGRALFGTLLEEETHIVRHAMETLLSNFTRAVVPWGKLLHKLPLPSTRRIKSAQKNMHDLIARMITARRNDPSNTSKDLLSTLIAATDPDTNSLKLTDIQLRDQAITILTAGHETTANAMTFTLYLLAKHPEEQKKLYEEIAPILGNSDPTVAMLDHMPRIRHVLSESMRLLPPVWTVGRQNQRPVTLAGYTLPPKCTILAPQWTLHRNPKFWPDPLTFNPDRWQNPTHPRFAYFPFSTGPRNCIGEAFAWLEMSLALPLLLRNFEFILPANTPDLRLTPSITLRPRDPVLLQLKTRR